jgi:hypothetical protein
MTETVVSCDRCRRVHRDAHGFPEIGAVKLTPFGAGCPFVGDLHLCPRCTHAFRRWLDQGAQPDDPDPGETPPEVKAAPWSDRPRRPRGNRR